MLRLETLFGRWWTVILVVVLAVMMAGSAEGGIYLTLSNKECPQYLEIRKKDLYTPERASVEFWINGFLTAAHLYRDDTYSLLGGSRVDAAYLWLENWCRNHPFKSMSQGMEAFVTERHPHRLKVKPK